MSTPPVIQAGLDREAEVTDVLVDAFRDYPVMRHIVGPAEDYERRLTALVGFFVARRLRQAGPGRAIAEHGQMVAAAVFTLPDEPAGSSEIEALREALWRDLGDETRRRYEGYAEATRAFALTEPHHHLNMIGVRPSHQGRGLARLLLDQMRAMAEADPGSTGVSLTTEWHRNVALYEHFGYAVTGHVHVAPGLESWGLFLRLRGGEAV